MSHTHMWAAYGLHLGFIQSRCRCGALTFLGGYQDPRSNRITDRLNRSWRVGHTTEARP